MIADRLYRRLGARFRRRRMREFRRRFPDPGRVLDVGGTAAFWRSVGSEGLRPVLVNVAQLPDAAGFSQVVADARALPFRDGAFDLVFSNSVIEHVGSSESSSQGVSRHQTTIGILPAVATLRLRNRRGQLLYQGLHRRCYF